MAHRVLAVIALFVILTLSFFLLACEEGGSSDRNQSPFGDDDDDFSFQENVEAIFPAAAAEDTGRFYGLRTSAQEVVIKTATGSSVEEGALFTVSFSEGADVYYVDVIDQSGQSIGQSTPLLAATIDGIPAYVGEYTIDESLGFRGWEFSLSAPDDDDDDDDDDDNNDDDDDDDNNDDNDDTVDPIDIDCPEGKSCVVDTVDAVYVALAEANGYLVGFDHVGVSTVDTVKMFFEEAPGRFDYDSVTSDGAFGFFTPEEVNDYVPVVILNNGNEIWPWLGDDNFWEFSGCYRIQLEDTNYRLRRGEFTTLETKFSPAAAGNFAEFPIFNNDGHVVYKIRKQIGNDGWVTADYPVQMAR